MNENQKLAFIGLANAIQERAENSEWHEEKNIWILPEKLPNPYTKGTLKSLCEYGLIRVWTVSNIAWGSYDDDPIQHRDFTEYRIKVTKKGWLYYSGAIKTVEKPCNFRESSWYFPVCKRHGRKHYKGEVL